MVVRNSTLWLAVSVSQQHARIVVNCFVLSEFARNWLPASWELPEQLCHRQTIKIGLAQ